MWYQMMVNYRRYIYPVTGMREKNIQRELWEYDGIHSLCHLSPLSLVDALVSFLYNGSPHFHHSSP